MPRVTRNNFGFLQDSDGNKSSKRLYGSIFLLSALLSGGYILFMSTLTGIKTPQPAIDVFHGFLYAFYVTVFGVVIERWPFSFKRKSKKDV